MCGDVGERVRRLTLARRELVYKESVCFWLLSRLYMYVCSLGCFTQQHSDRTPAKLHSSRRQQFHSLFSLLSPCSWMDPSERLLLCSLINANWTADEQLWANWIWWGALFKAHSSSFILRLILAFHSCAQKSLIWMAYNIWYWNLFPFRLNSSNKSLWNKIFI